MKKHIFTFTWIVASATLACAQVIPNAGFENWQMDSTDFGTTVENPTGWTTDNFGIPFSSDPVTKTTDNNSGTYAVKVAQVALGSNQLPAFLMATMPTSQKSMYLNGFCKSTLSTNDTFAIFVVYHSSMTNETYGGGEYASAASPAWRAFNIALSVPGTFIPDSAAIYVTVQGPGTPVGLLDDLAFSDTAAGTSFGNTITMGVIGIKTSEPLSSTLYPNPVINKSVLSFEVQQPSDVTVKITDIMGKEISTPVKNQKLSGMQHVDVNAADLSNGIYFYTITMGETTVTKKFVVSK